MYEMLIPYFVPMLWAGFSTAAVLTGWDDFETRRQPYRFVKLAAMTEKEFNRRKSRDSRGLHRIVGGLNQSLDFFTSEEKLGFSMNRMLQMMGSSRTREDVFSQGLLHGLAGAIPLLSVPVLTEQWGWIVLYPVFSAGILYRSIRRIRLDFNLWQQQLVRDIPEVIDHLRISFAAGRNYLSALSQAGGGSGPAMGQALEQLVHDIHTVGSAEALRLFSASFDLPIMSKLAAAIRLAIESGHEAAESYFTNIEDEILLLRQEAAEALTRAKPEKIYQLYVLLFGLALAALGLKCFEIFNLVSKLLI
ncbi:MAG TPA: hypothetical protein DIT32_02770 [Peptococcaceae bacterium]|nr:hypothetical protein [Peptococcaceae bacterium]